VLCSVPPAAVVPLTHNMLACRRCSSEGALAAGFELVTSRRMVCNGQAVLVLMCTCRDCVAWTLWIRSLPSVIADTKDSMYAAVPIGASRMSLSIRAWDMVCRSIQHAPDVHSCSRSREPSPGREHARSRRGGQRRRRGTFLARARGSVAQGSAGPGPERGQESEAGQVGWRAGL